MKLNCDAGKQRRFDRTIGVLTFINHVLPMDLDWRIRTGRALV